MSDLHSHLPRDLRDTDVVSVEVTAPWKVRVTHRDGTAAVHVFDPEQFHGDFVELRDPQRFTTATVVDGDTLGWITRDGLVYDVAPDALWLHANGWCDGTHDLDAEVEQ